MQKATVTAAQPTGQWNDLYKFEVTLSDGATGLVFGKSPQLRFAIGEEVEYEVPKEGRLKLNKPNPMGNTFGNNTGGASTSYSSNRKDYSKQHALTAACTFLNGSKATKEQIVALSTYFAGWLKESAAPQVQQASHAESALTPVAVAPPAPAPAPAAAPTFGDDLPF